MLLYKSSSRRISDQKAALQEILLHHQGGTTNYPGNLLPSSPRTLATSNDPLLLTHPVLTPHLTSGTTNLSGQQQIPQTLVPLSHEHGNDGINTLYSSLQSAPKKRKLSQDGLVHVKQVNFPTTRSFACVSMFPFFVSFFYFFLFFSLQLHF